MSGIVIDHTSTTIVVHKGVTPPELSTNTKRDTVDGPDDLGRLSDELLLRLGNGIMGTNAEVLPKDGAVIVWDALDKLGDGSVEFNTAAPQDPQPMSEKNSGKKGKKSKTKDLQSSSTDGNSSSPGADAGPTKETTMSDKKSNKAKAKKAAPKAKAKKATKAGNGGARGEKTLAVKALLLRKTGCTRKDILEKTGWPSVSVQAMAKACGLKLHQEKAEDKPGKPTVYYGSEK